MILIVINVILKTFARSAIWVMVLLLELVLNVQPTVWNVQLMLAFVQDARVALQL